MYVKKFEADSLDEALKNIKRELGPDAIILKTVSNKGIKGAFKKKKIEITAAISEKSYVKKSNVDQVFNPEQKDEFYNNNASNIANMIDLHDEHNAPDAKPKSYGNLALNKVVKNASNAIKSGLDDFLGSSTKSEEIPQRRQEEVKVQEEVRLPQRPKIELPIQKNEIINDERNMQVDREARHELDRYKNKVDDLEKKLFLLTKQMDHLKPNEDPTFLELRSYLKSLNLNEQFIKDLFKKINFEISEEDRKDEEILHEFVLREVAEKINTELPLFSQIGDDPVVTVLISDGSVGQTSLSLKLCALKDNSVLLKLTGDSHLENFKNTISLLDIEMKTLNSIQEIVGEARKLTEEGYNVFIDYKSPKKGIEETKKFIEGLHRVFKKIEVLGCISSIHEEFYNRRVLNKYEKLLNGLVVTNIDLCLNYGALFNLHYKFNKLPLKFFGTGNTIPDDIETATAERILSGMFRFD